MDRLRVLTNRILITGALALVAFLGPSCPGRPSPDIPTFNVSAAASTGSGSMTVTFDDTPDAAQAALAGNYSVPGLTLGSPGLIGNVVTLTTSVQSATTYTVTVNGVTRASDGTMLTVQSATFTGHPRFNVASAASTGNVRMTVTFDAPPEAGSATTLGNYSVPGLVLGGSPLLSGNTVTLTTSSQSAIPYTVTVTGVTRASDGEPLTVATADFTGRTSFNVSSAASTGLTTMTVTYDAPPGSVSATTLGDYSVPGLILSGVPVLAGNTVTLTTTSQTGSSYTVTVSGVTRAADGEALTQDSATFSPYYHVDAATGSDTNPGSSALPFKTISHALSLSASGRTVQVRPGTYDAANGETFPLQVPAGVSLIGDEPNLGAGVTPTLITGGDPAINAGANSVIAGFTVTDASGYGAKLGAGGVTLRKNTFTGNMHAAIFVYGGSTNHIITGNVIRDNLDTGLWFADGGVGSRVEGNIIKGNLYGVIYDSDGGDLGGGVAGSAGGNRIGCNTWAGVYLSNLVTTVVVSAKNNIWDHAPPTKIKGVSFPGPGLDVIVISALAADVDFTGWLTAGSCP
jgi:predicted RNA-binding protein with TRAM domain